MAFISSNAVVHRGHREARRALDKWLNFTRIRKNQIEKNWQACEDVDPTRLSVQDQVKRGDFGDNVIPLGVERPSLDSMDQLPPQSYSISVDNEEIKLVISKINEAVRSYFYAPATVLTYVDFCELLERIKSSEEAYAESYDTASIYERDSELIDCHYAFIHAGMGKLTGDVETGVSSETPESLEVAVAMLASLCANAGSQHVNKLKSAHTAAQNLQMLLAGKPHTPTPRII